MGMKRSSRAGGTVRPGPRSRLLAIPALPALIGLASFLLAGCGAAPPSSSTQASPAAQARPETRDRDWSDGSRGAELVATGGQSFRGSPRFHCVLHEESGVQISLRTGDAGLPAVTLRLDDFQGDGSYSARLFVTGRNGTGALVRSLGAASLELRGAASSSPAEPILLTGSFEGTYGGQAGRGSVHGRFAGCPYRRTRGGPPLLADSKL
jgi:hypothetical protein